MQYRKLGDTNVKITPIAFGAWAIGGWMWGGTNRKEATEAVQKSIDIGITTIDTAAVYGFGLSEEIVGEAINIPRDKVQIFTKCGLRWDLEAGTHFFDSQDDKGNPVSIYKYSGKDSIIEECERSLKRLNTDYIDLYQIHWHDPSTPAAEAMEAMDKLLQQGKIRAAGVSNYSVDMLKDAEKYLKLASNQVPYSMVERDIENEVVPYSLERNVGIIAYSPMQRGILTGKMHKNYPFDKGDHRPSLPRYKEPNFSRILDFVEKLKPIAKEKGITLPQLVLNWTMNRPGITCVLAGSRKPSQIEDNAKAINVKINEEEYKKINQYMEELDLEL